MKKSLFIIAAVGGSLLGFTSCSNDEIIAENESINDANVISFRPLVSGNTRAVDQDVTALQASGNGFYVTAQHQTTSPYTYFDNVQFKWNSTNNTYNSDNKYYWPSANTLDFYAYAPATGADIARTNYTTFVVTPNATPASQEDFIYAVTKGKTKAGSTSGVALNFRHAESKIVIKLKNSNSGLKITVKDVAIVNVTNKATFTWINSINSSLETADNTDGNNSAYYLNSTSWSAADGATTTSYSQTATTTDYISTTPETALPADMILVPQTLTLNTVYAGSEQSTSTFNGAYISVKLKIQNSANPYAYIVGGDDDSAADADNEGYVTAMWPLATVSSWLPGHKYTYTVELSGGGYFPKKHSNDGTTALDPILAGAEIMFASVTVDAWTTFEENGNVYTGVTPSTPVVP